MVCLASIKAGSALSCPTGQRERSPSPLQHNCNKGGRLVPNQPPASWARTDEKCAAALGFADLGVLKYLQFYNLTCNDCGGRTSNRCINSMSCAMAPAECTCPGSRPTSSSSTEPSPSPDPSPSPEPSPSPSPSPAQGAPEATAPCSYANFSL